MAVNLKYMDEVEEFLLNNGFTQVYDDFQNELCVITVSDRYIVSDQSGDMVSDDLNIYWLIGVLTYYGLMDKNYNQ